jgi:hypothetical protein
MGLYNFFWQRLPKPLGKKKCLLCESAIMPQDRNPGKDAFQYVCDTCNPSVVISISGSLLASSLYAKLMKDDEVRKGLHLEVRNTHSKEFVLDTLVVNRLLLARV